MTNIKIINRDIKANFEIRIFDKENKKTKVISILTTIGLDELKKIIEEKIK